MNYSHRLSLYSIFTLVLLMLEALPFAVRAQTIPDSVLPGVLDKHFNRKPVEPVEPQVPFIPLPSVPSGVEAEESGPQFVLRGIQIEGVTAYKAGTFEALFSQDIGKSIALSHAQTEASAITMRYRNDGYIL